MSRIGREPIAIPEGVTISFVGNEVTVKGPKGTLTKKFNPHITFEEKDGKFYCKRPSDAIVRKRNHGTARSVINGMVEGVTKGFTKILVIKGVGYRAEMRGSDLVLHLGRSHEDVVKPIEGVKISINTKTLEINVEGIDKQLVGQQAAVIRALRKPECYHGKGIRYKDEVVTLRAPASAKKSAAGSAA